MLGHAKQQWHGSSVRHDAFIHVFLHGPTNELLSRHRFRSFCKQLAMKPTTSNFFAQNPNVSVSAGAPFLTMPGDRRTAAPKRRVLPAMDSDQSEEDIVNKAAGVDSSEEEDEVFAVRDDSSEDSDASEDGSHGSDESDDEDEDQSNEKNTEEKGWGKKKDAYYDADNADYELDSDDEDARLEEEEALRIQTVRAKSMSDADFGLDELTTDNVQSASGDKLAAELDAVLLGQASKKFADMSPAEKRHLVLADAPELMSLLDDLKLRTKECNDVLLPALDKAKSVNITSAGLSYLEAKTQLMLSYCSNIIVYLMLKADGRSVADHPVMRKLLECRLLIDKLRPIDGKLKYQIDKLLRACQTENDADMSFKPALGDDSDDEADHVDKKSIVAAKFGAADKDDAVYKAPRITAVHFDEGKDKSAKKQRAEERKLKKQSQSVMVRVLRQEFSDLPEEAGNIGSHKDLADDREAEIRAYEEERMMRVTLSKKDKSLLKRKHRIGTFDDFDDFADLDTDTNNVARTTSGADSVLKRRSLSEYAAAATTETDRRRKSKSSTGAASATITTNAFYSILFRRRRCPSPRSSCCGCSCSGSKGEVIPRACRRRRAS